MRQIPGSKKCSCSTRERASWCSGWRTRRRPLYGVNAKFEPLKVAVDDAGSIYVISKGNTNGIAQFSADGAFLGYFGANDTDLSLMEKLQRLTYTQEQLEQLKRVVPPTPTSLDMDTHNLIYTVTAGVSGMKRLNMAGRNIMDPTNQGFDNAVDIVVGAQENIYLINEQGFIMEFTRDGRMLFLFGGQDNDRTRTGLFVATVAIDVDSRGRLYVLDRDKELVQRFAITDYAALVHEALALYQDGRYAESLRTLGAGSGAEQHVRLRADGPGPRLLQA